MVGAVFGAKVESCLVSLRVLPQSGQAAGLSDRVRARCSKDFWQLEQRYS